MSTEANQQLLLRPIRSRRLSELAVDQITAHIEEGRYAVGEKLPSESDLTEQLHVSRTSVREALRILEAQGLIQVQPGKGAFVVGVAAQANFQAGLMAWFEEHLHEVSDILAVRELLESHSAHIAAESASPETVAELRGAVEEMQECVDRGTLVDAARADRSFHRLLYKATGNRFLEMLGDSIVATLLEPRRSLLRLPGRAQGSVDEHRAIVECIAAGDAEGARLRVSEHLTRIRDQIARLRQTPA
jgi:GntR family transcriptional repressor for pyruvate dehydrogenase complex